jgi:hypothetical protein
MEAQYQNFSAQLRKFIQDLDRYVPGGPGIRNLLQVFDNLDMAKVAIRFHQQMKPHQDNLAAKNEVIFSKSFVMLPDVNISTYWTKLSTGQKAKMWTHLMILYIHSELLTSGSDTTTSSKSEQKTVTPVDSVMPESKEIVVTKTDGQLSADFNPYVGVGSDNGEYNVEDMIAGVQNLPDQQTSLGVGAIAKLVGLDKVFNMDELQEQLKNMDEDDIKQATDSIKGMMGNNVDEKTSAIMSDMLRSIAEELQKDDIKGGNPFDSLSRIADTVSQKIRPRFEEDGVDMHQLWQSTRNMSGQLKDKNGNPIFSGTGGKNPVDMLNKMMSGKMSEQDCMNNCNSMLQEMGVNMNQGNIGGGGKGKRGKRYRK